MEGWIDGWISNGWISDGWMDSIHILKQQQPLLT
jgi:hypothetical protein